MGSCEPVYVSVKVKVKRSYMYYSWWVVRGMRSAIVQDCGDVLVAVDLTSDVLFQ